MTYRELRLQSRWANWLLLSAALLVPPLGGLRRSSDWVAWAAFSIAFLALSLYGQSYRIEVTAVGISKRVFGLRREVLWREAKPAFSRLSLGSLWAPTLAGRTIVVQDGQQRITFKVPWNSRARFGFRGNAFGGIFPTGLEDARWLVDEVGRHAGFDDHLRAIVERDKDKQ